LAGISYSVNPFSESGGKMKQKIRIGALISGGGTNLQAIIDACESGAIDGEMVFVGSDNPEAKGLKRAKDHGIPTLDVDYRSIIKAYKAAPEEASVPDDLDLPDILSKQTLFPPGTENDRQIGFVTTRAIAEAKLLKEMEPYPFDLLVLAGFMRNLTPYFIDRVNTIPGRYRIMNIHPALLPAFPGVDGYGDTFRYGCKVGGCTVHFIDYGEDSGPIIGQKTYEVSPEDSLESVKAKGLVLEWQLYPECIQMFAQNRIVIVAPSENGGDGGASLRTIVQITPPD
jgi:phosphoribosylglycinamide formyltransferase-1